MHFITFLLLIDRACGVILSELIDRSPPFPGHDALHQMDLIISRLGLPSLEFIQSCRRAAFRKRLRDLYSSLHIDFGVAPIEMIYNYKQISTDSLRLLKSLLAIEPSLRITAREALKDPYFAGFQDHSKLCNDAISKPTVIHNSSDFAFELNSDMDIHAFRYEILKEMN